MKTRTLRVRTLAVLNGQSLRMTPKAEPRELEQWQCRCTAWMWAAEQRCCACGAMKPEAKDGDGRAEARIAEQEHVVEALRKREKESTD